METKDIKDRSSMAYDTPSPVSTDEVSLTEEEKWTAQFEHEKAIAWAEFEAEMRSLDYENSYNTYK